jgi:hypothetical protein
MISYCSRSQSGIVVSEWRNYSTCMAWTPPIPEPVWNSASPEVQTAILALVEFYEQRLAKLEARVNDLENRQLVETPVF